MLLKNAKGVIVKVTCEWSEHDVYRGAIFFAEWDRESRKCVICQEKWDLFFIIDIKVGARVETPKPLSTAQEIAVFLTKLNARPEAL